jgi:fatty-acyl-CoA synthase
MSSERIAGHALSWAAAQFRDRPAVVFRDRSFSYTQIERRSNQLANTLIGLGLQPGQRLAVLLNNSVHSIESQFGAEKAALGYVALNARHTLREQAGILSDAEASVLIAGPEFRDLVLQLRALVPSLRHVIGVGWHDAHVLAYDTLLARAAERAPWLKVSADLLLRIAYTSGTTGQPKGCMHSHRTVMSTTVYSSEWFKISNEVTYLGVLPYFHVTGMQNSMNTPIYSGGTVILLPRWDRESAGPLIARYGIKAWTLIPTMVVDLLMSPNVASWDLSSLQRMSGGGAAMPEAIATKLKELCGISFVEGYGLTETMAPSHVNPPDRPKKQCLGIPFIGTDSRIVDPVTLEELPVGEVGEIVSAGPQVFLGYWGKPEATAEAFFERDGKRFFRTGDLGRMDEEGYFFLVDRLKRMINAHGLKVWPAEVEALLYGHPDVQEACVISAKDATRGETVKAVVVLKPASKGKVEGEAITAWAREKMAAYKVPRVVEFVDALPRSATGKIQWRALQERENAKQ